MSEELEEYLHDEIEALTKANMQLQKEAEEQDARIKRLEEAGNAMYLHNGIHGSCKFCRELEARWIKAKNDKP